MPKRQLRTERHVHRLKKYKYPKTGGAVYFCTLTDCHYKVEVQFALGKNTICNLCGEEFTITENTLKLVRPHCNKCGRVRKTHEDGSVSYEKKVANHILSGIATGSVDELRARLDSATAIVDEDDI